MKVFYKSFLICVCVGLISTELQAKSIRRSMNGLESVERSFDVQSGISKIIDVSHHAGPVVDSFTIRFQGGDPLINYLPSAPADAPESADEGVQSTGAIKEYQFFFPNAKVAGKVTHKFIQQMNATMHPAYHVVLTPTNTPISGQMLTIRFDSKQVGFQVDTGRSPKGEPSVTLTFSHLPRLQHINAQRKTVLNIASLESAHVKKNYA